MCVCVCVCANKETGFKTFFLNEVKSSNVGQQKNRMKSKINQYLVFLFWFQDFY